MAYNPYREDGPEVKAQDKMNKAVGNVVDSASSATNKAYNYASDAANVAFPQKKLMGMADDNILSPIKNRISASMARQDQVLGTAMNNKSRQGFGDPSIDNIPRVVGGNFNPLEARQGLLRTNNPVAPQPMRDGIQSQRIDPETASSFMRAQQQVQQPVQQPGVQQPGPGRLVTTDQRAPIMTTQQGNDTRYAIGADSVTVHGDSKIRDPLNRAPVMNVGNASRIGNLDVQFDPATRQAARNAFMTNPVRPTAQINRFNAMQPSNQWQLASQNASQILGMNRPKETTQEQRQAASVAQELADKQRSFSMAERKMNDEAMIAGQRNEVDMANVRNAEQQTKNIYEQNQQKNALDQKQFAASSALTEEQRKGLNLSNEQAARVADMQNRYIDPKTPPEEKKQLEDQMYAIGLKKRPEPMIIKEKGESGGVPTETNYVYDPTTQKARKAVDEGETPQLQAPPTALEALAKDPKRINDFVKKYGYRPKGY